MRLRDMSWERNKGLQDQNVQLRARNELGEASRWRRDEMHTHFRWRALVKAAIAVSFVALSGCTNSAERLYEGAEPGQALPTPLPPSTLEFGYGVSCKQRGTDLFPGIVRMQVAKVLKSDQGMIAAKSLLEERINHWMMILGRDCTYTLMVEVPEDVFFEPVGFWGERMAEVGAATTRYDMIGGLMSMADVKAEKKPAFMSFPPRESTLGEVIRDFLAGRYGFGAFLEVARQKKKNVPAPGSLKPTNVPEYLALVDEILMLLPESATLTVSGKVAEMPITLSETPASGRHGVPTLYEMAGDYPEAFEGLTQQGFHWRGGKNGVKLETRNLGKRLIKIELHYSAGKAIGSLAEEKEVKPSSATLNPADTHQ